MPDQPVLSVIIVTWNSSGVIGACLKSLATQTLRGFSTLIIDNYSADETLSTVEGSELPLHVLRNPRNVGFARAVNQGIAVTRAPVVVVLNPDTELEPRALENALATLNAHPDIGSVAPWLFRSSDDLSAESPHGTVDSSGLGVTRGRRVVDRDAGREPTARPPGPVFGASGAFALYRRTALESVRFHHEFFDEDFFAYKEDADLAWRLQRAGWGCWFEPSSRAIHRRGLGAVDRGTSDLGSHGRRSGVLARLSYRNHLLMLMKNETASDLVSDLPWVVVEEVSKFGYYLLRRPAALAAWMDALGKRGRMRTKRELILRHAIVPITVVRDRWFRYR